MPQDFYGEGDESSASPKGHDESTPHEDKDGMEDKDEGQTALVPKAWFMGKKFSVGEEFVGEIVHEYEDEIEVKYATGEKEKSAKPKSQMDQSNDALERMGKPAEMGGY